MTDLRINNNNINQRGVGRGLGREVGKKVGLHGVAGLPSLGRMGYIAQLHTPTDWSMNPQPWLPHPAPHEFFIRQASAVALQPMRVTPWLGTLLRVVKTPDLQNCIPQAAMAMVRTRRCSWFTIQAQSPYLILALSLMNTLLFRQVSELMNFLSHSVRVPSNLALSSQQYTELCPTPAVLTQSQAPEKYPPRHPFRSLLLNPQEMTSWMDRKVTSTPQILQVTVMASRAAMVQQAPQMPWAMAVLPRHPQSTEMAGGLEQTGRPCLSRAAASALPWFCTSRGTTSLAQRRLNSSGLRSVYRLTPTPQVLLVCTLCWLMLLMLMLKTVCRQVDSSLGLRVTALGLYLATYSSYRRLICEPVSGAGVLTTQVPVTVPFTTGTLLAALWVPDSSAELTLELLSTPVAAKGIVFPLWVGSTGVGAVELGLRPGGVGPVVTMLTGRVLRSTGAAGVPAPVPVLVLAVRLPLTTWQTLEPGSLSSTVLVGMSLKSPLMRVLRIWSLGWPVGVMVVTEPPLASLVVVMVVGDPEDTTMLGAPLLPAAGWIIAFTKPPKLSCLPACWTGCWTGC